jgi:tRNA(Ile)-lysidine synthetase-like protein
VVGSPTGPGSFFSRLWELSQSFSFDLGGKTFLLALSGGRDSVCLFHFFRYLELRGNFNWLCVHINHELRGKQSQADEEFCRDLCQRYSVEFEVLMAPIQGKSNLQECARKLRYDALKALAHPGDETWVVTGHHQDDSLESLLIGLHQGRFDQRVLPLQIVNWGHRLYRPLAQTSRSSITEACSELGDGWREDSSNLCEGYLRNYYRSSNLLQTARATLLRLGCELTELASARDQFFCDFFRVQVKTSPKLRLESELLRFPKCSFEEFHPKLFQGFWFWFLSKNQPQFMEFLDLKRLPQALSPGRKLPRLFPLSKSATQKLLLLETAKDFVLRTESIIHTNSTPNAI